MFSFRRLSLGVLLGLSVTTGVFAATQPASALSIDDEYTEIKSKGIIFANICTNARPTSGEDTCACRAQGKCTVDDVLQVFVNVSYLVLALSGTAALIALIYGGFEWVISAGNPDRVKRGKDSLTGAVIGLAIVFGAYAFINLLIGVLNSGNVPTGDIEDTIDGRVNTGSETTPPPSAGTIINTEEPETEDEE